MVDIIQSLLDTKDIWLHPGQVTHNGPRWCMCYPYQPVDLWTWLTLFRLLWTSKIFAYPYRTSCSSWSKVMLAIAPRASWSVNMVDMIQAPLNTKQLIVVQGDGSYSISSQLICEYGWHYLGSFGHLRYLPIHAGQAAHSGPRWCLRNP